MEFNVLKRDKRTIDRRHDLVISPENQQNHVKLERYQVTEEELRKIRNWFAHPNCIANRVTIASVTFNDKKASLLAQAIARNSSITSLHIKKCKIKVNHMEKIAHAIGSNESIESITFEKCNLL